jgi:hypothetical protein
MPSSLPSGSNLPLSVLNDYKLPWSKKPLAYPKLKRYRPQYVPYTNEEDLRLYFTGW